MPISESFLATCRATIDDQAELTTFRTAFGLYESASHANKSQYWHLAFNDAQAGLSPAYALKAVIRGVAQTTADSTISPLERESAYRTLVAEYVPDVKQPMTAPEEAAALTELLVQELLS